MLRAWSAFCSTSRTVVPCSLISRIVWKTCWTRIGERPSDGSSRSRRRGADISARPIASICCSPPDSVPPSWWVRSRSRGKRSITRSTSGLDRLLVAGEGAHLEVLEDGHPREDPASLGGVADADHDELVGSGPRDVLALEDDVATARVEQAADRLEGRRLAGAVRPDQGHDLALLDRERDRPGGHGCCRSRCCTSSRTSIAPSTGAAAGGGVALAAVMRPVLRGRPR